MQSDFAISASEVFLYRDVRRRADRRDRKQSISARSRRVTELDTVVDDYSRVVAQRLEINGTVVVNLTGTRTPGCPLALDPPLFKIADPQPQMPPVVL